MTSGFGTQRRARERAQREAAVLAAAERVIGREGLHHAGMVEIAREAEYAIGTLYCLFPSKDALYEALVVARAEELAGATRDALATTGTARERLERALEAKVGFFERHQDFLRIYASTSMVATAGWSGPAAAIQIRLRTLALLTACFRDARTRGELQSDAEAEDLATAFQSLSTTYLVAALVEGHGLDRAHPLAAMRNVFFEPILGGRAGVSVPSVRKRRTRS